MPPIAIANAINLMMIKIFCGNEAVNLIEAV